MKLRINGEIGMWPNTHEAVAERLDMSDDRELHVVLNSMGGLVTEGLGIYYELATRNYDRVEIEIVALAASMGSVIALAGTHIKMAEDALFMIHNPWAGAGGDKNELRKAADQLEKWGDSLAGIYARKTGLPTERITEMMDAETWLNAQEALALGFVDEISEARREKIAESSIPAAALAKRLTGGTTATHGANTMNEFAEKLRALQKAAALQDAAQRVATASGWDQAKVEQALGGTLKVDDTFLRAAAGVLGGDASELIEAAKRSDLYAAADPAPQPAPNAAAEAVAAMRAEQQRVVEVRALAAKHNMPTEQTDQVIARTDTLESARAEILEWRVSNSQTGSGAINSHVMVGDDSVGKFKNAAISAILHRAGQAGVVKQAGVQLVDPGEFQGWRMSNLARHYLELRGVATHGKSDKDVVKMVLGAHGGIITQTTDDFPILLQEALHKALLANYAITPDTWSTWCAVGSVTDFRPHYRYRMGFFTRLDGLNESGEYRTKNIPDGEREVQQAQTFGNIINISREALINDDLSAFDRLAGMLGRAARLSIELDALNVLTDTSITMDDGEPLFSALHDNIAGAGAAPSVDSLADAADLMGEQTDPSGAEKLDLQPAIFLGPRGISRDAQVINEAQFSPDASNSSTPNKSRGLFRDVVGTARLSGNAWYMFADPQIAPAVEVAFLNGVQEPYMEMQEAFRSDGVEWKVRLDYGVRPIDYRAVIRNDGA